MRIGLTIPLEVIFPVIGLAAVTHGYYVFDQFALEFPEVHALQLCKTNPEMAIISKFLVKGKVFRFGDGKNKIGKVFLDHPLARLVEFEMDCARVQRGCYMRLSV